jgi:hypothetical protein
MRRAQIRLIFLGASADIGAVFVVGSIGEGESSLYSFIIDSVHSYDKPSFRRGHGIESVTKKYQVQKCVLDGHHIALVDTPGLNDYDLDSKNMIDVLEALQNVQHILAVIFCTKYGRRIDNKKE